jgi:hypothetical protein
MKSITRTLFVVMLTPMLLLTACGKKESKSAATTGAGQSAVPAGAFEGVISMTTTLPKAGTTDMKLMVGKKGMRAENSINIGGHASTMTVTVLALKEKPGKIWMINGESGECMELDATTAGAHSAKDPYRDAKIETLGKETIRGFDCTHVKISWPGRDTVIDLWISKDILDFYSYAQIQGADGDTMTRLADKLKAAGAEGFPIKMLLSPSGVLTELTKVERTVPDDNLFVVPANSARMEMPAGPHGYSK